MAGHPRKCFVCIALEISQQQVIETNTEPAEIYMHLYMAFISEPFFITTISMSRLSH